MYRAGLRIFGTPLAADEIAAFVKMTAGPDPIDALAKRLSHRPGTVPFSGSLKSGPTTFRVLLPSSPIFIKTMPKAPWFFRKQTSAELSGLCF